MFMQKLLSQTRFSRNTSTILSGILGGDQFGVISNDQRDHAIGKYQPYLT